MEKQRMNITIPKPVYEELENYCKDYGLSKGGAIGMILQQHFEQKEVLKRSKNIPDIIEQLQTLANKVKKDN